jgi:hypothetical protein
MVDKEKKRKKYAVISFPCCNCFLIKRFPIPPFPSVPPWEHENEEKEKTYIDEPGINGAKHQAAIVVRLLDLGRVLEQPTQLDGTKVRRDGKSADLLLVGNEGTII